MKHLILLFTLLMGCTYKPLYQTNTEISQYKLKIVAKTDQRYNNEISLFKLYLNKHLNLNSKKPSNIKLVVTIQRQKSSMGINKDLSTSGVLSKYIVNYSLYDKKGLLTSGDIYKESTFNFSNNSYGNLVSDEDTSIKLIKSLSESLSHIILTSNFKRKIYP